MRYLVRDEDGQPLRRFHSKTEAEAFAAMGDYSIEKIPVPPKPPKTDMVAEYGEAPY